MATDPPGSSSQLEDLRRQLDLLDDRLVDLLDERARLAQRIGRLKAEAGMPRSAPAREREILDRAAARAGQGAFDPDEVVALFRRILDHCREVQLPRGAAAGDGSRPGR